MSEQPFGDNPWYTIQLEDGIFVSEAFCVLCRKPIKGDAQYHQVYDHKTGKLVGLRHRRCVTL